ncbi:ribonuclease H2 non-catalytic subunit-domain-containing protein, partial [Aspergillus californicus]
MSGRNLFTQFKLRALLFGITEIFPHFTRQRVASLGIPPTFQHPTKKQHSLYYNTRCYTTLYLASSRFQNIPVLELNKMFAIQPQQTAEPKPSDNCTPNILPCRIHHDGPVSSLDRYWTPTPDEKDKSLQTAYFRGRKLRGRRVQIPEGYEGIVATHTDREMPTTIDDTSISGEEAELEEPVKILEKQATFDDYVVWGHETIPAADDPFVKGVEEWVKFAETMHTENGQEKKAS